MRQHWKENKDVWLKWLERKKLPYLEEVKNIVDIYLREPYLSQREVERRTGISKSTVSRRIRELARIEAIRVVKMPIVGNRCWYYVNPHFPKYLYSKLSTDMSHSDLSDKPRGLPVPPQDLVRHGWFRVHGFQRIWYLRNYKLIDDYDKWKLFAELLGSKYKPIKKFIGKGKTGFMYIIDVFSNVLRAHLRLQFRSNTLIISPRGKEGIYIPWDNFDEHIESRIIEEITFWAERAIEKYSAVFSQDVTGYDAGWVGKKKPLKPEVAYVDPDGIVKTFHDLKGAVEFKEFCWIDNSKKSAPEIEFEKIESASKFKRAVDLLGSSDFEDKLESMIKKVDALASMLSDRIPKLIESYLSRKGLQHTRNCFCCLFIPYNICKGEEQLHYAA